MDTAQIIQTVNAVGSTADSKNWKKCREQFADTVFIDYSSLTGIQGSEMKSDDLMEAWAKVLGPVRATQHMLTNHEVSVSGADATVSSYITALHHHPLNQGEDFWILYGKYEHRLQKQKGQWKIMSMKLTVAYQLGNKKLLELAGKK